MEIRFTKKFLKELSKIPMKTRVEVEKFVFDELPKINELNKVVGIKKLAGYKHFYRKRFGQYRLGIELTNDSLLVKRILHRKEIYKYFP